MLKIVYIALLITIIINSAIRNNAYFSNNSERIYFNNIGQGDSILINSSDNNRILIDSGLDVTVLEELAETLPFYDKSLDILILSHLDADHVAGFIEVLEQYQVKQVWVNGSSKNNLLLAYLYRLLEQENAEVYELKQGDLLRVGCCLDFEFIWPLESPSTSLKENDLSLAFILHKDDFKAYFAGDLSSEYELAALKNFKGEIDFMKVSHHGSKTSTSAEVLDMLKPKIAIISVGEADKFGHPHQEILENLAAVNAKVYRTDIHGRIQINIKEGELQLSTEKK